MVRAVLTQRLADTPDGSGQASHGREVMSEATEPKQVPMATRTVEGRPLEVSVDERGIERAMRRLKRKIATEGVTRELKRRRHYEKPSVRKRRKSREAERRRRRRERRARRPPTP